MARSQDLFLDFAAALKHLRDEKTGISPAALFALSGASKPEVAQFARVWGELSADRRRRVAQTMVDLAEESFEADFDPLFRAILDDEEPEVRARAIEGLWEDEDPQLIQPLIAFLRSDPNARVRAAAATSLGRFVYLAGLEKISSARGQLVRDALLAAIRNLAEDLEVRRRALESLAYAGDEEIRGLIAAAYEDDNPRLRASAVFAMGRSADHDWRRTVEDELNSLDPEIRYEAARAAGELEDKRAVPRLLRLLDDADREVQAAAIAALGQIGGKPAREALERLIAEGDELMCEAAADALDELEFTDGSQLLLYDMDASGDLGLLEEDEDLDESEEDDLEEE
jgi:HEAT repeat protein